MASIQPFADNSVTVNPIASDMQPRQLAGIWIGPLLPRPFMHGRYVHSGRLTMKFQNCAQCPPDFRFHIPCFENPFVFILFSFLFWRLPLIGGGGGCIRPIVARVTWDFACVFVCFGSGILFVSLEKIFILVLAGARFPSLQAQNIQYLSNLLSSSPISDRVVPTRNTGHITTAIQVSKRLQRHKIFMFSKNQNPKITDRFLYNKDPKITRL